MPEEGISEEGPAVHGTASEGISGESLVGSWRLVAHFYLAEDGSTRPGPCGEHAEGLLIYDGRGYMSAALMRTGRPAADGSGTRAGYMGYSGRWRVAGDRVVHEVLVSSHPRVVNTEQVREARLENGRLTLRERLGGAPRSLVLQWRRADPTPTEKKVTQMNGIDMAGGAS
ncbi:lipocalin-like domain-containing protein [Streptomyces sp. NPDC052109]|uniref:lipocalin-like domain-containing protein n=1 Tax=Streptomyces sp. NPDC052109 TaxID=3155527 RepID=UPI003416D44C